VELAVPAWIVALMVALPLVFAPLRALIGHKSDTHKSVLGWRRVPYIWFGSMFQFGGLALMPFALILLSGDSTGPAWIGQAGAAAAFLLVGAGIHTVQTAGLALASDLATDDTRPRVVALLYIMLLAGMFASSLVFGWLLRDFNTLILIQVIQGAAVLTILLNVIALWKQEARNPALTAPGRAHASFSETWARLTQDRNTVRLLIAAGLGAAAFSMQDVLLEPYGAEVLGMSVADTTRLTALSAFGALMGFAYCSGQLSEGGEPHRLAGLGAVAGVFAFALVILAQPIGSTAAFLLGALLIGFGSGLFAVGTLTAVMGIARRHDSGIALGAWGAVTATATGMAVAFGGAARDIVSGLANSGQLGPAFTGPAPGYGVVYHFEILLLFATLVVIGPLARHTLAPPSNPSTKFGLAAYPG
ncbi:MAG: MFS transporter, partial [Hyphomonas sp.]|uniref:MFS transporter n=1 Tax=Hyphomonas sp. TaxID=87 RepID=UPI00349FEA34